MSDLKSHEKIIFDNLFNRGGGGGVLGFTDQTFAELFREYDIDIDNSKYCLYGFSKMKRLRTFWEIEPNYIVGRVLKELLECSCTIGSIDMEDKAKASTIIYRLLGKNSNSHTVSTEQDFLEQSYDEIDWNKLDMNAQLQTAVEQRIKEIKKCISVDAPLAVIFLCGSTLEGLLLEVSSQNSTSFKQANSAPKIKNSVIEDIEKWRLQSLIDVAYEVSFLSLDVKKHSHSLRDFRNYIHPHRQASDEFDPDLYTAKISWQVLRAAIDQIIRKKQGNDTRGGV